MSCRSRAILVRSAAAAITACWSRSTSSLRARSSIQARYLLPEPAARPANSAATTMADRKSSERGTVPAGCHLTAAMAAPASSTPVASRARIRDSCAASVYSATSSTASPSSGKPSTHWMSAMALATTKTADGYRRRPASTTISAVWTMAASLPEKTDQASQSEHAARSSVTSSKSVASGWVRIRRRLWPNRPREISSGGCSPGHSRAGHAPAPGGAGSLVVMSMRFLRPRLPAAYPSGSRHPRGCAASSLVGAVTWAPYQT
jgi:hypothetical protein